MPPSLEELILDGHFDFPHKFTGGIPSEWGSLTNLKKLSMVDCGLDGASRAVHALQKPITFALSHRTAAKGDAGVARKSQPH